jgi:hypothetical protein
MGYCKACIEKDLKIEELKEQVKSLQAKLMYRQRKEKEGYFGASTPSSKIPFKKNSSEEKTKNKGGGVPGHKGHGRPAHTEETADTIIACAVGDTCPDCGGALTVKKTQNRTVIESAPAKPESILYRLAVKECKHSIKHSEQKRLQCSPRVSTVIRSPPGLRSCTMSTASLWEESRR